MSPIFAYSSPTANRDKYRRSLSQGKTGEFNQSLNKIINENAAKETQIQKNDRSRQKLAQTIHNKDLKQQIKFAQNIRHQLKSSNLQMDEDYINMYH